MKKLLLVLPFLLITSCEVERIEGIPSLNPPLGLVVQQVGSDGIGLYFFGYNKESYFYGYSIFMSTRAEDFQKNIDLTFGVNPLEVEGTQARMLTNQNSGETSVSIICSIMSSPITSPIVYPQNAVLGSPDPLNPTITNFISTSFNKLPPLPDGSDGNSSFVSGTTYYFTVYAYSTINPEGKRLSLPSEIKTLVFN